MFYNRKFIEVLLFMSMIALIGCNQEVLKYKNTADLKVDSISKNGKTYFVVSGLCMNSSFNVDYVISKITGDSLIVEVLLTLKRKKRSSGNFSKIILVNNHINMILFGKERKVIWKAI